MIRTPLRVLLVCALAALAACGAQSPQAGDVASASTASALAAGAGGGNLLASPKAEVIAAFDRLGAARSYRAVIEGNEVSGQERLQIDFVAPDRARVTHAEGVQTIIGADMYLEFEGQKVKQPVQAGALDGLSGQWKHVARLLTLPSISVESAGSERIDGQDTRKYRVSSAEMGGNVGVVWIGDGYPVRIDTLGEAEPDGTQPVERMRYSHINDPGVRVEPPG
jgi:hypothetical protein